MKKYKARREREQQEAIVRPRLEIEDPSAELFLQSRPWKHDDPLQDSFLEQTEVSQPTKEFHRIPKLKYRSNSDMESEHQRPPQSRRERANLHDTDNQQDSPTSSIPTSEHSSAPFDHSFINWDTDPEVVEETSSTPSPTDEVPTLPQRHPDHTPSIPIRSSSLPPLRSHDALSVSPPKITFQLFSQRCAPSPTSSSPMTTSPIFELSANEIVSSIASATESESPVELEGSPIESRVSYPAPLHLHGKIQPDSEPEASPYNRFTAFTKSIHALNASLSPIEETEEEAASRRSSLAQVYELPAITPLTSILPSAYTGGTCITPRSQRFNVATRQEPLSTPTRQTSTRSSISADSVHSAHSTFSFEYSNSDTEKIYVSVPIVRSESLAPSLTDVSSVDDFELEFDLDGDARRSNSISRRDAKLERFFGIRQYSVSAESNSSLDSDQCPPTPSDVLPDNQRTPSTPLSPTHRHTRSSISIDDLDLSLALESDPYKRELMLMHRSILYKSQIKQDAKLEKFFGCDKDEIELARKFSTGSRLAGSSDDLKYRSIGW